MLRVSLLVCECVLVALVIGSMVRPAYSADWYVAKPTPKMIDDWIVSVDAAVTASSVQSYFVGAGVTAAIPGSLSTSGARLRIEGLEGTYEYLSASKTQIRGRQVEASGLIGFEWVGPFSKVGAYLGGSALNTSLSKPDLNNKATGTSEGLKAAIDYYARPSERTMVSAYGSFATNDRQFFTRVRAGYLLPAGVYLGPEAAFMGNNSYALWQIGAFLTGMQLGPVQGGLSFGYQQDRDHKSGVYGSADLRVLF